MLYVTPYPLFIYTERILKILFKMKGHGYSFKQWYLQDLKNRNSGTSCESVIIEASRRQSWPAAASSLRRTSCGYQQVPSLASVASVIIHQYHYLVLRILIPRRSGTNFAVNRQRDVGIASQPLHESPFPCLVTIMAGRRQHTSDAR